METSRVTSQGQVTIPASIRKSYGLGGGATIEWIEQDGVLIVKRRDTVTFEEMRKNIFPNGVPKPKYATKEEAITAYILEKHGPKVKRARG